MSADVAAPSREAVLWAAKRTIRMHDEEPSNDRAAGRCAQCQDGGGCPELRWAIAVVEEAQ